MNITLISFYNRFDEYPTKFNLATMRLASVLARDERNRVELVPFDLDHADHDYETVYRNILQSSADIVGMSAYVWTWNTARQIRNMFCDSGIAPYFVVGGPEVQNRTPEGWSGGEIFVSGEGECFWQELTERLASGCSFRELAASESLGSCRRDGWFMISPPAPLTCGLPLLSDLFLERVRGYFTTDDFMWYETARGCPYHCGYCGHKSRQGIAAFNSVITKEEIKKIGVYGIKRVFVVDPIIGGTKENGKQVFKWFRQYAPYTKIIAYLRPEYIDEEYIEILCSSNIEEIRIGIQTLTETVPKWVRNNNIQHIMKMLPMLGAHEIPWRAELIVGLPGDNMEGLKNTLETVIRFIHPTFIYAYHLSVLKETPLFRLNDRNCEQWIEVGENGISAKSSYSYGEREMIEMLSYADEVTGAYNRRVSVSGIKSIMGQSTMGSLDGCEQT